MVLAGLSREPVTTVHEIDEELAGHLSAATLAAVRQDDPLAFGIDRLRAARATYARSLAAQARRELAVASRRHWGRRDNQALTRCRSTLQRSDEAMAAAVEAERAARRRLEAEVAHQRERTRATEGVRPQRVELTQALGQLDTGLDDTRAARVAAISAEPLAPDHLVRSLGEPPADPAAREAWCCLAYRVESYRDRHPDARSRGPRWRGGRHRPPSG